jgi:hypothetical protein
MSEAKETDAGFLRRLIKCGGILDTEMRDRVKAIANKVEMMDFPPSQLEEPKDDTLGFVVGVHIYEQEYKQPSLHNLSLYQKISREFAPILRPLILEEIRRSVKLSVRQRFGTPLKWEIGFIRQPEGTDWNWTQEEISKAFGIQCVYEPRPLGWDDSFLKDVEAYSLVQAVGTTAAAKILQERVEQSGPHAGEPVVGDDPNEVSGFTYTPTEVKPLFNGLPVVMTDMPNPYAVSSFNYLGFEDKAEEKESVKHLITAPVYVDSEVLKNDQEWLRNILMGEAQSPVSVCPQEHHLKDGKCMRDYCFCSCQKCKTDCGEK